MLRIVAFYVLLLITSFGIAGDPSVWNWGEMPDQAQGKWNYLRISVDKQNYTEALEPARWLLQNRPDLHENLYVYAETAFTKSINLEKDLTVKQQLQDELLSLYDNRIQYFGKEAYVLNKKGAYAWAYEHKDESKTDELFTLYKKIYQLNGDGISTRSSYYYMNLACEELEQGKLTDKEVFELYKQLNETLDHQLQANASNEKMASGIEKTKEGLKFEFDKHIEMSCDRVKSFYGEDFNKTPTVDLAKEIQTGFEAQSCTTDPLYISATKYLIRDTPTLRNYQVLANVYEGLKETDSSLTYYDYSINISKEPQVTADLRMKKAGIYQSKHDFVSAREELNLAVQSSPAFSSKAYSQIADMYVSSVNSCGDDMVAQWAVFIAAYEMYKKAGNTSGMEKCQSKFPTMTKLFERNLTEGADAATGCWINETVKLQKK